MLSYQTVVDRANHHFYAKYNGGGKGTGNLSWLDRT